MATPNDPNSVTTIPENPQPAEEASVEPGTLMTVDPDKRVDKIAKAYVATAADLDQFIKALTALRRSPDDSLFNENGKWGCETAAEAIVASLKRETYDKETDLKCLLALDASRRLIKEYASVSFEHLSSVLSVVSSLKDYVEDQSVTRPLNFMVIADPGSGKSHLVKCIANAVGVKTVLVDEKIVQVDEKIVQVVPFNMATMQSKRDLVGVINECRNIIVERKMPIAFLDEFDSDVKNYAMLLPLLWDGELPFENRPLKVGRSVFVLAGSSKAIPERLKETRLCLPPESEATSDDEGEEIEGTEKPKANENKKKEESEGKIVDLLSRINGSVITIPPYDTKGNIQPDKVVVAIARLRDRFKKCENVPVALLKFISCAAFRHSSRSIQTLVNEIPRLPDQSPESQPSIEIDQVRRLGLDNEKAFEASPMAYHLQHPDGIKGICELWNDCLKTKHKQRIHSDHLNLGDYSHESLGAAMIKIAKELAPDGAA